MVELLEHPKPVQMMKVDAQDNYELAPSIDWLLGGRRKRIDGEIIDVIKNHAPNQLQSYVSELVQNRIARDFKRERKYFSFMAITSRVKKSGKQDWFASKNLTDESWHDWSIAEIGYPVELSEYKARVPAEVLRKIKIFEAMPTIRKSGIMQDFECNYYVADLIRKPDPILFVQIGPFKELRIYLGYWG
ncbi:MAG: hypothetical protein PHQ35_11045 [Phycisphaerae bacterium]|nr:hypothetical protein [Phycisphaerae bacterium]